jgi:2-keto-4-pentenoate hydratase/2-oxohepta-3-ene-1,7-dioic acid hydratase in catechol pathway
MGGREEITRVLVSAPHLAHGSWDELPTRRMERVVLEEANLLAPIVPSKIVCVGRNYRDHAAELGNELPKEPLIFLKPPSSLIGAGQSIHRPAISERVDYEGELGVVIGRECRKLGDEEDPRGYILGYTSVNDVTARDLQTKDEQWTRAIRSVRWVRWSAMK